MTEVDPSPEPHDPKASVCVVIPLPTRKTITDQEELSLRHLDRFLGRYDRYFICSPGSKSDVAQRPGYEVRIFEKGFFGSVQAHNQLLLSKEFYERFSDYEYLLIYHLDSLVFSDELDRWCSAGYDYIGSPWVRGPDLEWVKTERVGNGGFSLRRIPSLLRVLNTNSYPVVSTVSTVTKMPFATRLKRSAKRLLLGSKSEPATMERTLKEQIDFYLASGWHEDRFWADQAPRYDREFRVAPVEVALKFAFEANPRLCFERAGRVTPFGCHAWEDYDRSFWEPLLIRDEPGSMTPRVATDAPSDESVA